MSEHSNVRMERRRVLRDGRPRWGEFADGRIVFPDGDSIQANEANHLPPCDPTKIICIHLNYDDRRVEFGIPQKTANPSYFFKPPSSLNAHGSLIHRPRGTQYLNYEGEIGVVIGRSARNVSIEDAFDYVAGYTPANDVGCHDFRDTDAGSMMRVKGMDGFCPIGPGLVSGIDIRRSTLRTYLNGQVVQEVKASDMEFGIDVLIADLSRYMTLMPGDLILSGTPRNSRPMSPGDVVEVEVTGVGRLHNQVVESPVGALPVGHPPMDSAHARRVALGSDYTPRPGEA